MIGFEKESEKNYKKLIKENLRIFLFHEAKKNKNKSGLTLFEIIIALALLVFLFGSVIGFAVNFQKIILSNNLRFQILSILQDEIEKMRAMDYENIGILGGWPPGNLPQQKIIEKNGLNFLVKYYIRNIDDPKDGTITSIPADSAPADYKIVELEGRCLNCAVFHRPQSLTSIIAPKTVESRTGNGSLFIQVLDANGLPIRGANLKIEHLGTPNFVIEDLTDNTGFLRLIDIPPGINTYRIYATKNNYSSERTYQPGNIQNPNPILPDQTVESTKLTTVTLKIDRLSILNFSFINKFCQPISEVQFTLEGSKLIGRDPNVLKTIIVTTTDTNGRKNFSIEWDDYNFVLNSSQYVLKSTINYLRPKIFVLPDKNYNFQITLASSSPINFLVTVLDPNKNYIPDAQVKLTGKDNYSLIEHTGVEKIITNDWRNNYLEKSDNIVVSTGGVKLKDMGGYYSTSTEWLISKTFDFGTSSTQFKIFSWKGNKPEDTSIKFQIAVNNDNFTWNFIGPDSTSNSYFEDDSFTLEQFNGNRFLRYKVYLKTDNENISPVLENIKINFSSNCFSSGQTIFQNLSPGNYTLEVTKQGFNTYTTSLSFSSNESYREVEINLLPE